MKNITRLMRIMLSIAALGIGSAWAGNVTIPNTIAVPNTFTAHTKAEADKVNQNFAAVADPVNDNFEAVRAEINDNDSRISANASKITANSNKISDNVAGIKDNATDIQQKGLIDVTVLTASCLGDVNFPEGSYVKLSDIGTFTKVLSESIIDVQFNGSVYATTMDGTGACFELRVDDQPTANGWARIALKQAAMGHETTGTMTAIFSNLSTGSHTVSVWVYGANGSGAGAFVDPGCWSSTHVIVKELN